MENGKKKLFVAQSYVKLGWDEKGATTKEEEIMNHIISSICDRDLDKGYIEYKKLHDTTKFLKRIVDQVYNKELRTFMHILDFLDLVDSLDQKFIIIWALFDRIILNDDSIGAKRFLTKLMNIKNLMNATGNFSEFEFRQMEIMEHQLNNLFTSMETFSTSMMELDLDGIEQEKIDATILKHLHCHCGLVKKFTLWEIGQKRLTMSYDLDKCLLEAISIKMKSYIVKKLIITVKKVIFGLLKNFLIHLRYPKKRKLIT